MTSVTVVVPAYNEGATFAGSLAALADYFAMHRGGDYEFHYLIVDDGSSDETGAVAETFARWRPTFACCTTTGTAASAPRCAPPSKRSTPISPSCWTPI